MNYTPWLIHSHYPELQLAGTEELLQHSQPYLGCFQRLQVYFCWLYLFLSYQNPAVFPDHFIRAQLQETGELFYFTSLTSLFPVVLITKDSCQDNLLGFLLFTPPYTVNVCYSHICKASAFRMLELLTSCVRCLVHTITISDQGTEH